MAILEGMSRWWCQAMHSTTMWPIHGKYVCRVCSREYPITWISTALEDREPSEANRLRAPRSLLQSGRVETL